MSVVNGKRGLSELPQTPPAPTQSSLSSRLEAEAIGPTGTFAGVVFNRPVDQVLHLPGSRAVRRGAIKVGPAGQCHRSGGGTRRSSVIACGSTTVLPEGVEPGEGQGASTEVLDRPAVDRRRDARTHPLDGRLLRLRLGPGARRGGPGRGQEAVGDPRIGTFLVVPEEAREKVASLRAEAAAQAGGGVRGPLTRSDRAVDPGGRLPDGQVRAGAGRKALREAGPRSCR